MAPQESTWQTPDGKKLYTRTWLPEGEPVAAVVLVHGLGEHCSRYDHVAALFNQRGIAVYSFDHRGHGNSSGPVGHIESYDAVNGDIDHFIADAQKSNPGKPIFLYGHSMGGSMVLYYTLKHQPAIAGVICTSPGLIPGTPPSPALFFAAKYLSKLLPSMTTNNGLDTNNLSHNREVVQQYIDDPLNTSKISFKLGYDLINCGQWVLDHAGSFSLPLLLMVGSEDHLVSTDAIKQFASVVPSGLLTFRIWEGQYHELHNEIHNEPPIQQMLDWINHRMGV